MVKHNKYNESTAGAVGGFRTPVRTSAMIKQFKGEGGEVYRLYKYRGRTYKILFSGGSVSQYEQHQMAQDLIDKEIQNSLKEIK